MMKQSTVLSNLRAALELALEALDDVDAQDKPQLTETLPLPLSGDDYIRQLKDTVAGTLVTRPKATEELIEEVRAAPPLPAKEDDWYPGEDDKPRSPWPQPKPGLDALGRKHRVHLYGRHLVRFKRLVHKHIHTMSLPQIKEKWRIPVSINSLRQYALGKRDKRLKGYPCPPHLLGDVTHGLLARKPK